MRKNGEYVGIDDKYIPEDEKYVDDPIIENNENIDEKVKSYVKKTGKVAKKIGIGYLFFIGIMLFFSIGMFIFITSIIMKNMDIMNNMLDNTTDIIKNEEMQNQINNTNKFIDDVQKQMQNQINSTDEFINNSQEQIQNQIKKQDVDIFNMDYEAYVGTRRILHVSTVLDNVITNNKKNKDKLITVVYNEISTTDSNKIIEIKHSFENGKEYEVMLDYNENGLVNKVTISDIK